MSVVTGAMGAEQEHLWLERGRELQGLGNGESTSIKVQCRTLSSILHECGDPQVDLVSLDVEGYELQVLKGLDLSLHHPKFILTETLITPLTVFCEYLGDKYSLVQELTPGDALFQAR